jgi:hypothetical protein
MLLCAAVLAASSDTHLNSVRPPSTPGHDIFIVACFLIYSTARGARRLLNRVVNFWPAV